MPATARCRFWILRFPCFFLWLLFEWLWSQPENYNSLCSVYTRSTAAGTPAPRPHEKPKDGRDRISRPVSLLPSARATKDVARVTREDCLNGRAARILAIRARSARGLTCRRRRQILSEPPGSPQNIAAGTPLPRKTKRPGDRSSGLQIFTFFGFSPAFLCALRPSAPLR
jgi:hypothetical protein